MRDHGWLLAILLTVGMLAAGCGVDAVNDRDPRPFPGDFQDIRGARPDLPHPAMRPTASAGIFVAPCGDNANGHNNFDNFITMPGMEGGASHEHDYVGNLSTDAFSTDTSLAAAGTTCRDGDQSTYFWPVLRLIEGGSQATGTRIGLRPAEVLVQFGGNPASPVVPMPRFLRMMTGDPMALTDGRSSAHAQWTCSGFTDRYLTRYPMCPANSKVMRVLDFPSCWDGRNTDSPDHRGYVVFPAANGVCPHTMFPVPQLHVVLTYDVPQGALFAVDGFPEQKHSPITDHAGFENLMSDELMAHVVACINEGSTC